MPPADLKELTDILRSRGLRNRTGLWAVPNSRIGKEAEDAAIHNISTVDLRQELLAQVPPGASYVPLDSDRLLELVDDLSQRIDRGNCVLVQTLDLLLARLSADQRTNFWQFTMQGLVYRPCALLFTLPATAHSLFPTGDLYHHWIRSGRFIPPS